MDLDLCSKLIVSTILTDSMSSLELRFAATLSPDCSQRTGVFISGLTDVSCRPGIRLYIKIFKLEEEKCRIKKYTTEKNYLLKDVGENGPDRRAEYI